MHTSLYKHIHVSVLGPPLHSASPERRRASVVSGFSASFCAMPKAIMQLTQAERVTIDRLILQDKSTPTEALDHINAARRRRKEPEVGKGSVHRYVKGLTHKLGAVEKRGRKRSLSPRDVRALDQARRRLIKKANNNVRVTHADVVEEAGVGEKAGERLCADVLRAGGVAYRAPRRKNMFPKTTPRYARRQLTSGRIARNRTGLRKCTAISIARPSHAH